MLGGKELTGRALDQRGKTFAGEPINLEAKTLGLRVELRPVGETSGSHVEEPRQAARRTVVDVGPRRSGYHAALEETISRSGC